MSNWFRVHGAMNSIGCSIGTARLRGIVENSIEFNYHFYSEKKRNKKNEKNIFSHSFVQHGRPPLL